MGRGTNIFGSSLIIGAVLGIIMTAVVLAGEAAVSTNEFCTSCHSMTYPEKELQDSSHYGALGANPGCKDCHIPQGLGNLHLAIATHVVDGARELYLEFANDYSTLEKFNERRLIMAHDARMNLKKWDSITCRECHRNPQPPGEDAQAAFNRTVKEKGMKEAMRQLGDAQLKDQLQANNVQERFTAAMQKLQTLFLNLAEPLMPVVDAFVSILGTVSSVVARFTPLLGFLVKAYALVKGIGLAFKGIQMTRAAIFSLGKQQLATDIASKNTTALQNTYLKVKEAFTNRGYVAAKAAYILEKIGLINAKQLSYWKGRETFFSKAKNRNLAIARVHEKASLLSSIKKNIQDKIGVATARVRSATEKGTLGTYLAQGVAKVFNNLKDRIALGIGVARGVAETTILGSMIAQGAATLVQIARQGILLAVTAAKAVAEFAAATAATLGIGTGPLIALAAVAAATVGGIIFALADDAKFEPKAPGYGKRELHDEGKITLFNDKDTIVAGTDLDKRSKNPRSSQPSTQFNQSLDYEKLAMTLGGVINNKQVTLSYSDFAQKTRPVFS